MASSSDSSSEIQSKEDLHSLLKFDSLQSAEKTLRQIHDRFLEFKRQGNRDGVRQCRTVLLKGKERALMISRNKKVNEAKRKEKLEIAQWFTVWLQTPEIFFDWLELRKASAEFHAEFVDQEL